MNELRAKEEERGSERDKMMGNETGIGFDAGLFFTG